MRAWSVLVAATLGLGACASHNSHRVQLELNEALAPLFDGAIEDLEQRWGRSLPAQGLDVDVSIEPVAIQWLVPGEPGQPRSALGRAELEALLEEGLRQSVVPDAAAPADFVLKVAVALDLHVPDELWLRVSTALEALEPREVLARGSSGCLELARLYCHGCHEAWSGLGSDLRPGQPGGDYVGGGVLVCFPTHGHSSGYVKH